MKINNLTNIICFIIFSYSLNAEIINVMTFNIKWDNNDNFIAMKTFFDLNKDKKPNIILLQEMHINYSNQNNINTVKEFANTLNYNFFYGFSRPDYEALGLVSTFPFAINPFTGEKAIWTLYFKENKKHKRIAIIADFKNSYLGRIRVINTHLEYEKNNGDTRRLQLQELIYFFENLQEILPADVIICGGDFNSNKNESFYKGELDYFYSNVNKINFTDFNGYESTSKDQRRIDYIFIHTKKIIFNYENLLFDQNINYDFYKNPISDHRAVLHQYHF